MTATIETADLVLKFINQTHKSIFLTGKAGTGKTTLLRKIIETTHKQTVVVAPTGIAALNAGGVTIHSQFQLPFAAFIPEFVAKPTFSDRVKFETKDTLVRHFSMNKQKKAVFLSIELLIIDEVSMLRADVLDAMDWTLRSVRKINEPFGGVQVLFIGDLLQLPPVMKNEEWSELRKYYEGIFFFHSKVIRENPPIYIELSKIYRQTDQQFIDVLNHLRNNEISQRDLEILSQFVNPSFDVESNSGYITLTTHNAKADELNAKSLAKLEGKSRKYSATITGEFPPHLFPLEEELELKVGAQVMFIKNDISFEKNFFNGKMGIVESLSPGEIFVRFPEENKVIEVETYEWQNIRYVQNENSGEIEETVLGNFEHYPIKLAWAITVHKSQGLTFDKAVLDVSQVFAPGQAYVALSRLRSLAGLVLLSPMKMNGIRNDQHVMNYAKAKAEEPFLLKSLELETRQFIQKQLTDAFQWSELAAKWRSHEYSYSSIGSKTEKAKHASWATRQSATVNDLIDPAQKFITQLQRLFQQPEIDIMFIQQRMIAAFDYFYKKLDDLVYSTLKKMIEIQRLKQIKAFYEELEELDEQQVQIVLNLKRAKNLMEAVANQREISKEVIWNSEIKNYKITKIALINQEMRQNKEVMQFDEVEETIPLLTKTRTKKVEKTTKKSTIEVTYEMIQEGKSVAQISRLRMLTEDTIYNHLIKLVKAEELEISDILPIERLHQLHRIFEDYEEESLSPLKEKHGDSFEWGELKLYRASRMM